MKRSRNSDEKFKKANDDLEPILVENSRQSRGVFKKKTSMEMSDNARRRKYASSKTSLGRLRPMDEEVQQVHEVLLEENTMTA